MAIDPKIAREFLRDVQETQERARELVGYSRSSIFLTMWGALTVVGYLFGFFFPERAPLAWLVIRIAGLAGTGLISLPRRRSARHARLDWLLFCGNVILVGYGWLWLILMGNFSSRSLDAYWPTVFCCGFVLAGLWLGQVFIWFGLAITALSVLGYYVTGPWYDLWMAVFCGGSLVLGGFWLNRKTLSR